jgi:hypothetical protein
MTKQQRAEIRAEIDKVLGPEKYGRGGLLKCRICGCTETEPCNPPCAWASGDFRGDICTSCADLAQAVAEWMEDARRPKPNRLIREARLLFENTPIPYVLAGKGES